MSLFWRTWQLIRANIRDLVEEAEDPEHILGQAVTELVEEGRKMRQAVAQAIAIQKRTQRQMAQAQVAAKQWYLRAQLALEKGNETLAHNSLTHRQTYITSAARLQQQLQQQREIIRRLKQELSTLEARISEAKMNKEMYVARARSAVAAQKIYELTSPSNSNITLNAFERMEEKVLQLEANAQAAAELSVKNPH